MNETSGDNRSMRNNARGIYGGVSKKGWTGWILGRRQTPVMYGAKHAGK